MAGPFFGCNTSTAVSPQPVGPGSRWPVGPVRHGGGALRLTNQQADDRHTMATWMNPHVIMKEQQLCLL